MSATKKRVDASGALAGSERIEFTRASIPL